MKNTPRHIPRHIPSLDTVTEQLHDGIFAPFLMSWSPSWRAIVNICREYMSWRFYVYVVKITCICRGEHLSWDLSWKSPVYVVKITYRGNMSWKIIHMSWKSPIVISYRDLMSWLYVVIIYRDDTSWWYIVNTIVMIYREYHSDDMSWIPSLWYVVNTIVIICRGFVSSLAIVKSHRDSLSYM